jgi:DNA-binding NarL/FixJ family response regulator
MLKILLAEDNPMDEAALLQYLKNNLGEDFASDTVKSCKEMLNVLEGNSSQYDIIILDHILEDEQSLKYISKIINKKSSHAEVIVLSGQSEISVCIQYLNAGVYAYLNKEAGAFKNLVKNIIEIRSKKLGKVSYFQVNKYVIYLLIAAVVILTGMALFLFSRK